LLVGVGPFALKANRISFLNQAILYQNFSNSGPALKSVALCVGNDLNARFMHNDKNDPAFGWAAARYTSARLGFI
jgi:hypothetical protein